MDAANPLCRFLPLVIGLWALVGCQSDSGVRARGQQPQDPRAPIAPPISPPAMPPGSPYAPLSPSTPPAPSGVVPAVPGAPVPGSPVPPGPRDPSVVKAGAVTPGPSVKTILTAAERLKNAAG